MFKNLKTEDQLNEAELLSIRRLKAKGLKLQEIAERIGTSIEVVKKIK